MQFFKKAASLLFRFAISAALLVFLFKFNKIDLHDLMRSIRSADKFYLFIAFLVTFLNYILCLLRWDMLLKAKNINLSLKRVITSYSGGVFFSLFLPTSIGGDVVRTVDLGAHTGQHKKVLASVLLDRLSGYVAAVLLSIAALALGWKIMRNTSVVAFILALAALLVCILLCIFNRFFYTRIKGLISSPKTGRLGEIISSLHEEMHFIRYHRKVVFYNIVLSLLVQAVTPVAYYITCISLGVNRDILYFFIFMPVIGALTLLPISIGGLGVRENMSVFFFSGIGVLQQTALAMSLFNSFFLLVYGSIGGLVYVFTVHHRRIQHDKTSVVRSPA